MSWHNGFVSEAVTGNKHKGNMLQPKSIFVLLVMNTTKSWSNLWNNLTFMLAVVLLYSCSNLIFSVRHCFSELVQDFTVVRKLSHMMPHVVCHRRVRPLIMGSVFPVWLSAHTYGCVTPDATVWCCEMQDYVCHMSPPIAEHKLTLNVTSSLFCDTGLIRCHTFQLLGIFCKMFHIAMNCTKGLFMSGFCSSMF